MADSLPQDWSRYWQHQHVTSFGKVFPDNYDGSIIDFWEEQLRGDLLEIVDVACGNGALTWIADEFLNRPSEKTRITGVDFATIDPFAVLRKSRSSFPNVRFIGNTLAEDLPFPDGSVDLVISQYGVEYTDIEKSVPEIARILKPRGRMVFVLHDKESKIIENAASQLDDIGTVFDLAIHDHAVKLSELGRILGTNEARQNSDEFRSITEKLSNLTEQVREIVRDYTATSPIHLYMTRLTSVFSAKPNEAISDPIAEIIAARDQLAAQFRRIHHMQTAALDSDRRDHLLELLERTGFPVVELDSLAYGEEPSIGTTLVASRR